MHDVSNVAIILSRLAANCIKMVEEWDADKKAETIYFIVFLLLSTWWVL